MNTLSSTSHGKTIRHTHTSQWSMGRGLNMVTERTGTSERANLRLDVYDSCDPTAILMVTTALPDNVAAHASIILNHEQVSTLATACAAFLEQYPHGIESANRLDRA